MNKPTSIRLLDIPKILGRRGGCRAALYNEIKAGTWTPFIKYGRTNYQPEHEVDVLLAARIAGKNDEELRTIATELIAERVKLLSTLRNQAA